MFKTSKSFKYSFLETELKKDENGQEDVCLIVLRDETGLVIPHPFSSYILEKYSGLSVGTQRNACKHLSFFLNFVSKYSHELDLDNFWDVSFSDVEIYLSQKIEDGCRRETIIQYRNTITNFLYYLAEKKLLNNISITDFSVERGPDGKMVVKAPLLMRLPKKMPIEKIHKIRTEFIPFFIHLAILYVPHIALGVYFVFYGGLRVGEVVNLTKVNMELIGPDGVDGFILYIEKNHFDGLSPGDAKKGRDQIVLPGGETIGRLYKLHLDKYAGDKRSNILFRDRNGNAMSDSTFRYHFNKLKKIFIQSLKDSGQIDIIMYAHFLESKAWSTHIGRGTYSNLLEEGGATLPQLAVMRGDSSYESSLAYLSDPSKIKKQCTELLEMAMINYLEKGKGNV